MDSPADLNRGVHFWQILLCLEEMDHPADLRDAFSQVQYNCFLSKHNLNYPNLFEWSQRSRVIEVTMYKQLPGVNHNEVFVLTNK